MVVIAFFRKLIEVRFHCVVVSSNVSAIIIHRQYYDNHLVFIHFKNIRHGRGPFKIAVEYRCTLGAPIEPYCVADWQQIPGCHVTSVENEVFYSCLILRNKVLLLYQYEIKAAVKLPLGWRNQTSNFTVKVSSMYFYKLACFCCRVER